MQKRTKEEIEKFEESRTTAIRWIQELSGENGDFFSLSIINGENHKGTNHLSCMPEYLLIDTHMSIARFYEAKLVGAYLIDDLAAMIFKQENEDEDQAEAGRS